MASNFNPRSREGSDVYTGTMTLHGTLFQSTLPRGERRRFSGNGSRWTSISIHAPARGATIVLNDALSFEQFQSTLPRGERLSGEGFQCLGYIFQSTLPRGERPCLRRKRQPIWHFNPRSREGSDCFFLAFRRQRNHFNPRSREGSDCTYGTYRRLQMISIRAPARGATICHFCRSNCHSNISIRAPARGATMWIDGCQCILVISIRAPARGATRTEAAKLTYSTISIRAPARGATLCAFPLPVPYIFQSALPRGERLCVVSRQQSSRHFNPRSREGSDLETVVGEKILKQFQSALPRGERRVSDIS